MFRDSPELIFPFSFLKNMIEDGKTYSDLANFLEKHVFSSNDMFKTELYSAIFVLFKGNKFRFFIDKYGPNTRINIMGLEPRIVVCNYAIDLDSIPTEEMITQIAFDLDRYLDGVYICSRCGTVMNKVGIYDIYYSKPFCKECYKVVKKDGLFNGIFD